MLVDSKSFCGGVCAVSFAYELALLLFTHANKGDTKSRYLGEILEDINCNCVPVLWNTIFLRVPLYIDFDLLDKLFPTFFEIQIEICGLKYKELRGRPN